MRKIDHSIPSEFIEFDTTVTDADEFVNIRDMQTFRANHNILLARRSRSQLAGQVFIDSSGNPLLLQSIEPVTSDISRGQLAFSCRVMLNEYCQNVKLVIWASRASVTGTPDSLLYPHISSSNSNSEIDTSIAITVDDTTPKAYVTTIPVQREPFTGIGIFSLYFTTPMSTAADDGYSPPLDITDVHNVKGEIVANFPASPIDKAMVFSDSTMPPRLVRKYDGSGGGTKWAGTERDWEGPTPIPGDTTVVVYSVATISLYALSIYPVECTDFTTWTDV